MQRERLFKSRQLEQEKPLWVPFRAIQLQREKYVAPVEAAERRLFARRALKRRKPLRKMMEKP